MKLGSGVVLLVALALVPAAARAEGRTPRVAVLGASWGVSDSASAAVERAAFEATRQAGADAVPPDEVARAVRAAKADVATCGTNAACAAAACGAVRADVLLTASIRDGGSHWILEMRLREGRRGVLRGQAVETVARDERAAREAAERLANRLVQQFLSPGALLPPPGALLASPTPAGRSPTTATQNGPSTTAATAIDLAPRRTTDERLTARDRLASEHSPSSRRGWSAIVAGGGAALLAGGLAVGALAWSESSGASASLARGDLGGFAAGRRSARTLAWTAAGLGGAGAAALAAGAWLSFGGGSSRVSLGVEPGMAGARVALAF